MITRAAYKLADLLAVLAIRVDRRRARTVEPESFPLAGCLLASACLIGIAAGWFGR